MAQQEYVVLRNTAPAVMRGGPVFGPLGFDPGMEAMEVEEHVLNDAERSEIAEDPRTEAIAAAMPMTLIEPVATKAAEPAAAATWGVEAVRATQSPFDGSGVTVAVLDTGIDPNHEAFAGVTLEQENFTAGGDDDEHGHGTHCAGTIFGHDTGGERIGVARGIDKALIGKVLGPGGGSSATIAKAINWAVNEGAHVISMSLGIDFPGFVDFLVDQGMDVRPATSMALAEYRRNINLFNTLAAAVQAQGAFGQGTIIVAATGNESERPSFRIAVAPPAAGEGITAIGALKQGPDGLTVARFSNTEPNVTAPGVDVVSARAGGGLASMDGTSMATPHVAGVAALWAQRLLDARGNVDSQVLRSQILVRADTSQLAPGFKQDDVGTGIVQAPL